MSGAVHALRAGPHLRWCAPTVASEGPPVPALAHCRVHEQPQQPQSANVLPMA